MKAYVKDSVVKQWPITETQIRNRGISAEFIHDVIERPKPAYFDVTQYVVERKPEVIDGVPYQTWEVLFYADARQRAKAAMVQWIDGITAQVMDQYPRAVQARWETEEAAARAVKAGTADTAQTTLVTREGATKGRTPEEHADAIIANADRFRGIADEINTLFLATDAALTAATDPAQYEIILDQAEQQAAPLAKAYGLNA